MSAEDLVETFDCDQGSAEWWNLRNGKLTSSVFGAMLPGGEGKTRTTLMYRLAGEILSGQPAETFESQAMIRGKIMEAKALEHYAFTRGIEVGKIGFVRRTVRRALGNDFVVGCSPDGAIGEDGLVQIKTSKPELIVALVESGRFPNEHRPQVQGELWVTGRKWSDLKIFYEDMPVSPTFRVDRDEDYIQMLSDGAEKFLHKLSELVKRVKRKGGVK